MADRVSTYNRSVQFTPVENMCLLEEYNSYTDILLGKISGECSNKKKCLIWKKIATTVNSVNPIVERSVKDVQKRYKNMVQDTLYTTRDTEALLRPTVSPTAFRKVPVA